MDEKNLLDLGKRISKAVQDAVNSKDFTDLKNFVNQTVHSVTGEHFRQDAPPEGRNPRPYSSQSRESRYHSQGPESQYWHKPPQDGRANQWTRPNTASYQRPPAARPYYTAPPPRRYSSTATGTILLVLGLVFGVPLVLGWGIGGLISLLGGAFDVLGVLSASLLPLIAGAGVMAVCGYRLRARNKRFQQYQQQLQGCKFYSIKQLAAGTGYTEAFVKKDLKKMIRLHMFREAFLDEQETSIILDKETYGQYCQALASMKKRKKEEEERKKQAEKDPMAAQSQAVVEEGFGYIRQIKEANDAIPGEVISEKLTRLEQISTKVFLHVKEHPKKVSQLRNFMDYYLPTTLKLVHAYRDFDQQDVEGENINAAKQNIENVLDTINDAFENLLDNLYEDDFIDINADISTMETLLRQDGLTDGDFDQSKGEGKEEKKT